MAERTNEMKKQYILYILEILKEYTDVDHPMDLQELKKILSERPYEVNIDRKAIWRTVDDLIALEYPIATTNTLENGTKVIRDGKPLRQRVYYDYSDHDITDSQIYLLIDTVLSSPHISEKEADATIEWLRNQASVSFRKRYKNAKSEDYGRHIAERVVLPTIESIDYAIQEDCQITFTYNDFDEKGRLKEKHRGVIVSPYYTLIRNGHYYLICCRDGESELYHYRLDKISEARTLSDKTRTPLESIYPNFKLNDYIQQHPYMFAGEVSRVRFLIKRERISALYDYFGNNAFSISRSREEDKAEITMKTNINGFYYWALQYGESVEILEPQALRDRMRQTVRSMVRTYSIANDDIYSEAIKRAKEEKTADDEAFLFLDGINLRGKRDHLDVENVTMLSVGYNSLESYEFVNRYEKVEHLYVCEPAILNNLNLNLPNLLQLTLKEKDMFNKDKYERLEAVKDFNFLSRCKNIRHMDLLKAKIDSFEGIYGLKKLEYIYVKKEDLEKIDLSRFSIPATVKKGPGAICMICFQDNIDRNESISDTKKEKTKSKKK